MSQPQMLFRPLMLTEHDMRAELDHSTEASPKLSSMVHTQSILAHTIAKYSRFEGYSPHMQAFALGRLNKTLYECS